MAKYLVKSHNPFNGHSEWFVESLSIFNIGQIISFSPVPGETIPGTVMRIEPGEGGGGGSRKEETEEEKERQRKKDSGEDWYWQK